MRASAGERDLQQWARQPTQGAILRFARVADADRTVPSTLRRTGVHGIDLHRLSCQSVKERLFLNPSGEFRMFTLRLQLRVLPLRETLFRHVSSESDECPFDLCGAAETPAHAFRDCINANDLVEAVQEMFRLIRIPRRISPDDWARSVPGNLAADESHFLPAGALIASGVSPIRRPIKESKRYKAVKTSMMKVAEECEKAWQRRNRELLCDHRGHAAPPADV